MEEKLKDSVFEELAEATPDDRQEEENDGLEERIQGFRTFLEHMHEKKPDRMVTISMEEYRYYLWTESQLNVLQNFYDDKKKQGDFIDIGIINMIFSFEQGKARKKEVSII